MIRLAASPILLAHEHAERRRCLLGIGHHVHVVTASRELMGGPIGAHAHPALYRREFADDADPHARNSRRPCAARSAMSAWASGVSPKARRPVQSSRAASSSNTAF